jgi:hypothetical protein
MLSRLARPHNIRITSIPLLCRNNFSTHNNDMLSYLQENGSYKNIVYKTGNNIMFKRCVITYGKPNYSELSMDEGEHKNLNLPDSSVWLISLCFPPLLQLPIIWSIVGLCGLGKDIQYCEYPNGKTITIDNLSSHMSNCVKIKGFTKKYNMDLLLINTTLIDQDSETKKFIDKYQNDYDKVYVTTIGETDTFHLLGVTDDNNYVSEFKLYDNNNFSNDTVTKFVKQYKK